MTTTLNTPGEHAAYIRGLEAREEARRLMAAPEYATSAAAQAKVRAHFLEAYGAGRTVSTAMGPGQVPANPFGRR